MRCDAQCLSVCVHSLECDPFCYYFGTISVKYHIYCWHNVCYKCCVKYKFDIYWSGLCICVYNVLWYIYDMNYYTIAWNIDIIKNAECITIHYWHICIILWLCKCRRIIYSSCHIVLFIITSIFVYVIYGTLYCMNVSMTCIYYKD